MKKEFAAYYRPTDGEFKSLWDTATFSFDTSALRNLYSYSDKTRDEMLELLKRLKGRVWSPFHVAKEYQLGRIEEIRKCINAYDKLKSELKKALAPLTEEKKHPFVDEKLFTELEALRSRVDSAMDDGRKRLESMKHRDPVRDVLDMILEDCIGPQFPQDHLEEIYREGKERYAKKIPPGYMDDDKGEPGMYGDLVIWKELIEFGRKSSKPVVFVTDDSKEDWWWLDGSMTIGPRPELREEFKQNAASDCYFYSFDRFVAEARKSVAQFISDDAAQEVKETAAERRNVEKRKSRNNFINSYAAAVQDAFRRKSLGKTDLRYWSKEVLEQLLQRPLSDRELEIVKRKLESPDVELIDLEKFRTRVERDIRTENQISQLLLLQQELNEHQRESKLRELDHRQIEPGKPIVE